MKHFFTFCALLAGFAMFAQQTHHIDWEMGITTAEASLTIDQGDTVMWTFTDNLPHSVTSGGGSAETFDSGILNAGSTYSYTFNVVGENPYACAVHPSMQGTITVNSLGVDEKNIRDFKMSPNPVTTEIFIELPGFVENLHIEVHDILGKLIYSQPVESLRSSINVSAWAKGVYVMKLTNGDISQTRRFIKN